jgi:hypothetical protein
MAITVVRTPSAIRALMSGPSGATAQDLRRRGNRVLNRARQLVPVDTGALRASLKLEMRTVGGEPQVRIGSALPYALFVHEGTGVYVGRGRIYPKQASVLRWPRINRSGRGFRRYQGGKTAAYVYARSIKGMKGTPYLLQALPAAAD